jgi:hypothetical protein
MIKSPVKIIKIEKHSLGLAEYFPWKVGGYSQDGTHGGSPALVTTI